MIIYLTPMRPRIFFNISVFFDSDRLETSAYLWSSHEIILEALCKLLSDMLPLYFDSRYAVTL